MSNCFVTTPVAGGMCPRCHSLILTGWAEGIRAVVDLTALNPTGELQALLANRSTYTLTRAGLVERNAGRIAADFLRGPTLTTHRCGQSMPASCHAPPGPALPTEPDQPPY